MMRTLVTLVAAGAAVGSLLSLPLAAQQRGGAGAARLNLVEATVQQLQHALQTKLITSEQLVEMYLARIEAYDDAGPQLNALLHVNAQATAEARQLDALRHPGRARSPLYGIPVLLKDNIDTADMPTTAGSVALAGSIPPDDAFITRKLRQAGAIIIGKATLTEFANFIAIGMPSGYSSLGGYGLNPYEPRTIIDGRPVMTPGGSSSGSGIGVSANFAAVAIGTETSGSILSPGSANMDVGIKPTVGLVSRDGIIPITADQDTAGPLARTVADAAVLLGAIAGFDPNDAATAPCLTPGNCFSDYTRFLDKNALRGARIAVPPLPGNATNRQELMDAAIAVLRAQGAHVELIPPLATQTGICVARPGPTDTCSTVLLYGQKRDLNSYLAATPGADVRTIADVVAFNAKNLPNGGKYGQAIFEAAASLDTSAGSADTARYLADLAADRSLSRGTLDAVYNGPDGDRGTADDFDAILFNANLGAGIAAKAGYPSITVPGGFIAPVDPITMPTPSGVTFSGRAFSESTLIGLAYDFEQATNHRVPPVSAPPLASDRISRP
jgi:amidase